MVNVCTICVHPQKQEIEKEIVSGRKLMTIAEQFKVSRYALSRHKKHAREVLAKAREIAEVTQADSLIQQINDLKMRGLTILNQAKSTGDNRTACIAIREVRNILELLAKISGELVDQPQINLLVSPQWINLRTTILRVLEPYPEIRASLVQKLQELKQ